MDASRALARFRASQLLLLPRRAICQRKPCAHATQTLRHRTRHQLLAHRRMSSETTTRNHVLRVASVNVYGFGTWDVATLIARRA
jgi:hypothetical protein